MTVRKPTKEELEKLRELGLTRQGIADHYNVSIAQVKRWIASFEVSKKTRSRPIIGSARVSRGISLPPNYGITLVEQAQNLLGSRMTHDRHKGYCVDGRPMKVTDIVKMLGLENKN